MENELGEKQQGMASELAEKVCGDLHDLDSRVLSKIKQLIMHYAKPSKPKPNSKPSKPKSKPNPKSRTQSKGSNHPNYYAAWHSLCCGKNQQYTHLIDNIMFKYQPDPTQLKDKQLELYQTITHPDNSEKYQKVLEFSGNLADAVDLAEKMFGVVQMARTSLVWNQFMSEADREAYRSGYNQANNIDPKPKLKLRLKTKSENRNPYEVTTEEDEQSDHT